MWIKAKSTIPRDHYTQMETTVYVFIKHHVKMDKYNDMLWLFFSFTFDKRESKLQWWLYVDYIFKASVNIFHSYVIVWFYK